MPKARHFDAELDASGLQCPLPVLRAKKALTRLQPGAVLCVISTDSSSVKDFAAFAKLTGNTLLESREQSGKYYFLIKRN